MICGIILKRKKKSNQNESMKQKSEWAIVFYRIKKKTEYDEFVPRENIQWINTDM